MGTIVVAIAASVMALLASIVATTQIQAQEEEEMTVAAK
jgi:hypothetical protein